MEKSITVKNKVTTNAGKRPEKSYYPALTGMRAVAAWMVFFFHFSPFSPGTLGERITGTFAIGVALFFVLSGLLICLRYFNRIELNRHWAKIYFRNRIARIYPMYFFIACVTFVIFTIKPTYDEYGGWTVHSLPEKVVMIGLSLTFLKGFFKTFIFTGIAPGWTLTVEECFYILAPFLLLGLHATRSKETRLVLYALVLSAIGSSLVLFKFHPYGFFESFDFLFRFTLFGRCVEFLAGMALALYLIKRGQKERDYAIYTWLGVFWIVTCVGVLVWLSATNMAPSWIMTSSIFVNNVILVPGICALYYGLITEKTALSQLLSGRLFILFGKASYAFYLVHMGVLSHFMQEYVTHNVFIQFIVANVLSIILFLLIEEPMHKVIAGRKRKNPPSLEHSTTTAVK